MDNEQLLMLKCMTMPQMSGKLLCTPTVKLHETLVYYFHHRLQCCLTSALSNVLVRIH